MKREHQNVEQIIRETVALLCRNGLSHRIGVRVQGLIGVTVDDSDVFLVQIDESYRAAADDRVHSSQTDGAGTPLATDSVVETPASKRKIRSAVSEARRRSDTMQLPATSASVSFVEESDVINIDDDADVKPDIRNKRAVKDDRSFEMPWENSMLNSGDTGPADNDYNGNVTGEDDQNGFVESDFLSPMQPDMMPDQNPQSDWQSQMFAYEQMTVQSDISQGTATTRHHIKQEYWNQPARQIVRRYRQRHQQQQHVLAGCGSDEGSLVLTRSLHECGYPGCGRQFRHKQHLRRHQTQKHGRLPTRVLGIQKVWMKPGDVNSAAGYHSMEGFPQF